MPPSDSAALIVARFLKANHFTESYETFVQEAGLPEDAGAFSKGDLTLETLLEEKKTFDLSVRFEKLGTGDDANSGWKSPAPSISHEVDALPSRANVLSTIVEDSRDDGTSSMPLLISSAADRQLHLLEMPSCELRRSLPNLHESPILTSGVFRDRILLTGTMSGTLLASDFQGKVFDKRNDHSKYIVKVAIHDIDSTKPLIATAGWDNKVHIYTPTITTTDDASTFTLNPPTSTLALETKPEAILFTSHPETNLPLLILSRTDSNFLYYYDPTSTPTPRLLGAQNLAPHSNAWISFTPSSLALHPTNPNLIAIGTNSVPHMKVLIARLLVPSWRKTSEVVPPSAEASTPASLARAAVARADREADAVLIHCNSQAPQTAYSTPAVAWRPGGSGVWVNGDDGVVRGVEGSSGKVVANLKGGHEDGSKVRCLWAGEVEGREVLVSGGFDRRLIVWRVE